MADKIRSLKIHSQDVTEGFRRAPSRAMLRAVGMTDDDFDKPQVGVASTWNEVTPCNLPLARLAQRAKDGVRAAGGFPFEFVSIAVSDGISMGHEGMHASLVSREIIADSVEAVMHAERFDAFVGLAGCDKSLPGMLMAAGRLDLPMVFVYGGTILPGHLGDRALDVVSVFEAVGARSAGTIDDAELDGDRAQRLPDGRLLRRHVHRQHDGLGRRSARHGAARQGPSAPAVDRRRDDIAYASGEAVIELAREGHPAAPDHDQGGLRERHRHGHGARRLDQRRASPARDRQRGPRRACSSTTSPASAGRVPHLADMKPHGRYHMTDLDRIGGVPGRAQGASRRGPAATATA